VRTLLGVRFCGVRLGIPERERFWSPLSVFGAACQLGCEGIVSKHGDDGLLGGTGISGGGTEVTTATACQSPPNRCRSIKPY